MLLICSNTPVIVSMESININFVISNSRQNGGKDNFELFGRGYFKN